jgi:hypothetical protein
LPALSEVALHPIVPRHLVGYVDTSACPSEEPAQLGTVTLQPTGPFQVREFVTLRLTYTVGQHGLDDRGAFKIVLRFPADGGAWQLSDPGAANFVSLHASRACQLHGQFSAFGDARPWFKVLSVQVRGGCLAPGDTVTVVLGDRQGGGPGMRLQTFCEDAWELRFLVDACATGHFVELPQSLSVRVVPGSPAHWRAVMPTRRRVGERFSLFLRADDAWGNPSDQAAATLHLTASGAIEGLPETVALAAGDFAVEVPGLHCPRLGEVRVTVRDDQGRVLCTANPLIAVDRGPNGYWADLHGQSGETVGINSARRYFEFARDKAFLDACSHQGNAFQINQAFWEHLNGLTAEFDEPGRFVTLPGYEWSGNTAVGGDRNVYFRHEGRAVRRSSHALLADRSEVHTDCTTAAKLFQALATEDAVAFAHVGGRYADLTAAHDGRTERSVEIHSAWGTFEWLLHDAFDLGFRVGVVANSDGHKGRPGASHPGASTFGAFGGLTCYRMPELTRDALMAALRARHHYGTSGARLDLDVQVQVSGMCFQDDPSLGATSATSVSVAGMGDIVATRASGVEVHISVAAASPIERIEVRVGKRTVHTLRPFDAGGRRIRVVWEGAEYRGRGRQTTWDGQARFTGVGLVRWAPFNHWNADRPFGEKAPGELCWSSITTGNHAGFDAWLDGDGGQLQVRTPHGTANVALDGLGIADRVFELGGLGRRIRVFRLPQENRTRSWKTSCRVPVRAVGDTPIWVCVTLESGHQAWSSPTYLVPADAS